jgi:ectoine hydroxylase-related dioxygenase (phytanoyl-CoA dioxygenase family)
MRPVFSPLDNFNDMRAALFSRSAFLVKNAMSKSMLEELARRAENAYRVWDHKTLTGRAQNLYDNGHIPISELGEFCKGYAGRLISECFRSKVSDMQLRRVGSVLKKVAFHQDEYFGLVTHKALGLPTDNMPLSVTIWMPLVDCGVDAPGLSVVTGSREPIVMGQPREGWPLYIWRRYGFNSVWSPQMNAGDLLVFTSRTIHGSYITKRMTKPRYSIEIRGDIH